MQQSVTCINVAFTSYSGKGIVKDSEKYSLANFYKRPYGYSYNMYQNQNYRFPMTVQFHSYVTDNRKRYKYH